MIYTKRQILNKNRLYEIKLTSPRIPTSGAETLTRVWSLAVIFFVKRYVEVFPK